MRNTRLIQMKTRIFFDSSALFSAALSATGAARELIRMAVRDEICLVISDDVLVEMRRNISQKAPDVMPLLDQLLQLIDFEIVPQPPSEEIKAASEYVAEKDAMIIAAAIKADVDYLATFDRKHLIDPPEVSAKSDLTIGTPGDIRNLIRAGR